MPDKLKRENNQWGIIRPEGEIIAKNDTLDVATEFYDYIKFQVMPFQYETTEYKPKKDGANPHGLCSGFYKSRPDDPYKTYLFKRSANDQPGRTIAEFVASRFYEDMEPGVAAKCVLAIRPSTLPVPTHDDNENPIDSIYVGSEFELDTQGRPKYREACVLAKRGKRSRRTDQPGAKALIKACQTGDSLEKTLSLVLWVGDNDTHSANMGALVDPISGVVEKAHKIDHDFSWYKSAGEEGNNIIDPFNPFAVSPILLSGGKIATQPTNHAADYAAYNHGEFYFSDKFLRTLQNILEKEETVILKSFRQSLTIVKNTYAAVDPNEPSTVAITALQSFANHLGIEEEKITTWSEQGADIFTEEIAQFLTKKMLKRQESIKKLHNKLVFAREMATSDTYTETVKHRWFSFGGFQLNENDREKKHLFSAISKFKEIDSDQDPLAPLAQGTVSFDNMKKHLQRAEYTTTLLSILKNIHDNHLNNTNISERLLKIAEYLAQHAARQLKSESNFHKQQGLMAILELFRNNQPPSAFDIKKIIKTYPLMCQGWRKKIGKWFGINNHSTVELLVVDLINDLTARQPLLKPGQDFYSAKQYKTTEQEAAVTTSLSQGVKNKIAGRIDDLESKILSSQNSLCSKILPSKNSAKIEQLTFSWQLLQKINSDSIQFTIDNEERIKLGSSRLTVLTEDAQDAVITPDYLQQDTKTLEIVRAVTQEYFIAAKKGFSLSTDTQGRIATHIRVLEERLKKPGYRCSLIPAWKQKINYLRALHQASIEEKLYIKADGTLEINNAIKCLQYPDTHPNEAPTKTDRHSLPTPNIDGGYNIFGSEVAAIIKLAKNDITVRRAKVIANLNWTVPRFSP